MRIALCDDEIIFSRSLAALIDECCHSPQDVSFFLSGEELLTAYQEGRADFDLIFLDIEMTGLDGLETANAIRYYDEQVMIVFVTIHHELVTVGYDVEAMGFLTKPVDERRFRQTFDRCQKRYQKMHQTLTFKIFDENDVCTIMPMTVKDMVYLYVINKNLARVVTLYMADGMSYRLAKGVRLSDLEKTLLAYDFCRCEQGCLVNLAYIQNVTSDKITLKPPYEKVQLPITRRYKKDFLQRFMAYFSGGFL